MRTGLVPSAGHSGSFPVRAWRLPQGAIVDQPPQRQCELASLAVPHAGGHTCSDFPREGMAVTSPQAVVPFFTPVSRRLRDAFGSHIASTFPVGHRSRWFTSAAAAGPSAHRPQMDRHGVRSLHDPLLPGQCSGRQHRLQGHPHPAGRRGRSGPVRQRPVTFRGGLDAQSAGLAERGLRRIPRHTPTGAGRSIVLQSTHSRLGTRRVVCRSAQFALWTPAAEMGALQRTLPER